MYIKSIYSEKATKFCEIFPLLLTVYTVAVWTKKTFFPLAIDVPPGYACRGVNKSHFFFSKIETVFLLR